VVKEKARGIGLQLQHRHAKRFHDCLRAASSGAAEHQRIAAAPAPDCQRWARIVMRRAAGHPSCAFLLHRAAD
jgi:hypothetical protein